MPSRLARRPILELALVVIVAAFVYIPFLGTRPLDFSEGHRAVPGWTMLDSGDFWHIKMFGLTYFRKPPGMPWVIAASSSIFGENAFGARFPSALAAILMSGIAWWYGRRWFGRSGGLIAGLAQALFPLMWSPGRSAEIEMLNNLGTQVFALGLIDLLLEVSRRKEAGAEEEEGPFTFLRGLCASARDCLVPVAGLLIAALAKGPASAPVLGGVLIGACIAARSLRPLRSPGLGICLILATSAIGLVGIKIYLANSTPDAVRENIAGQFLWSSKRVLGVLALIPIAFASALPMSLSLLVPLGTSNDRADHQTRLARTLAWSWLASLAIFVLCGVSDARYAMPAAVLFPLLIPHTVGWMSRRTLASDVIGRSRNLLDIAYRPGFWLGVLGMAAWWYIVFTGVSPTEGQRAGPAAAASLAAHMTGTVLWADDAIEARPDVLWEIQKKFPNLRVVWAKSAMHSAQWPPPDGFILIRTDAGSTEGTRYSALSGDATLLHIALDQSHEHLLTRVDEVMIRNYRLSLYQLKPPAWPLAP